MFFFIKTLKKFLAIFNSQAAPWQVFIGTLLGVLIGFLPLFPPTHGPAPLGLALVLLAVLINCHLGSVLLFFGLGWLLSKLLAGPAVVLGNHFSGLAQASADNAFLHMSLWSHTGWLGLTLIGLALAPLLAALMTWATWLFRTKLRDRLLARKKLVSAGKLGGNMLLVRAVCWFFDL